MTAVSKTFAAHTQILALVEDLKNKSMRCRNRLYKLDQVGDIIQELFYRPQPYVDQEIFAEHAVKQLTEAIAIVEQITEILGREDKKTQSP